MTDASAEPGRPSSRIHRLALSPALAFAAFALVHVWLAFLCFTLTVSGMGDVEIVYLDWAQQALVGGSWVGIDTVWVYPVLALAPILAAAVLGWSNYALAWLILVSVLDLIAFGAVVRWVSESRRLPTLWWWTAFLLLLGPIAVSRLDAITVALAIPGALLLASRPRIAGILLAFATWIKVWPAALIAAGFIALRGRWRMLVAVVVTSLVIVGVAMGFGSGTRVLSFVTEQTVRSLQVEAPVTTIWLWRAFAGGRDTSVFFDTEILTFEVRGPGVAQAAALMTPLLAIVLLSVVALGSWAARRGADQHALLPVLSLAVVVAFIAFNKVGSPQYIAWLAVPVLLGLATASRAKQRREGPSQAAPPPMTTNSFAVPAVVCLGIAALTQLIYPVLYDGLLMLNPAMLVVLTLRNLLEFVLLGWAIRAMVGLGRSSDGGMMDDAATPVVAATTAVRK